MDEFAPTDRSGARPSVVIVLADDLGYSDIGCFGGEISTPNLDGLSRAGVRGTSFYNTARCSPSRASLLTGRHPHETGVGVLTDDLRAHGGYAGTLGTQFPTMAETLRAAGYATCLSGKWHLSSATQSPDWSWPTRRGFEEFFGIMPGADSYFHPRTLWHNETRVDTPTSDFYLTDAISEHAASFISQTADRPFFLFLAYTAPHWPLHAVEEDIRRYAGVYERGWDVLREERYRRMVEQGTVGPESPLSVRDPAQPAWEDVEEQSWEARRMSVYAAQVERMDRGVGVVLNALEDAGVRDNTLVLFLSDNGASSEPLPPTNAPHFLARQPSHTPDGTPMQIGNSPDVVPGPPTTYSSYGRSWANLSNTPFRFYKRWVHEGGISTPLIISWPQGQLAEGSVQRDAFQLTDVLPTVLDATGLEGPADAVGTSMLSSLRGGGAPAHTLFWEHVGNAAVRQGRWKIVRVADQPWELYDMDADRSETEDLAAREPDITARLAEEWTSWAQSVGVIPWDHMRDVVRTQGG